MSARKRLGGGAADDKRRSQADDKAELRAFAFYSLFGDSQPSSAKVIVASCSFHIAQDKKKGGWGWRIKTNGEIQLL